MHSSSTNRFRRSLICAAFLLGCSALAAQSDQSVTTAPSVEFAETSGVTSNVRDECTLDSRLPKFIRDFAAKKNITVNLAEGGKGRVLHLEFANIVGPGGGAWSGSKSVTVRGKLTEEGKVIGTFIASRYSGGGLFAGYKGTCSILGRCIKSIGKDIANWLVNPTMDAKLGNA